MTRLLLVLLLLGGAPALGYDLTQYLGFTQPVPAEENWDVWQRDFQAGVDRALMRRAISVRDPRFGAVCNGATDDWSAIQRALDAARTWHTSVVFPSCAEPYRISKPLILSTRTCVAGTRSGGMCLTDGDCPSSTCGAWSTSEQDLTLLGPRTATGAEIRPMTGFTGGALIDVGDGADLLSRWVIDGLSFNCRDGAGTALSLSATRVNNSAEWWWTHNVVASCDYGFRSPGAGTVQVGEISGNAIGSNNLVGIYLDIASSIRIVANHISEGRATGTSTSRAIDCPRCGPRMVISNNQINDWQGDWAIKVGPFGSSNTFGVIVGNDIDDVRGCVSMGEDNGATIKGNGCSNAKATANAAFSIVAADVTLSGNTVIGWTSGHGLAITSAHNDVSHNRFKGLTSTFFAVDCNDCTDTTFEANREYGGTANGGFRERNSAARNVWRTNVAETPAAAYSGIVATSRVEGVGATDAPSTCVADLDGAGYFDLSLGEPCVCNSQHTSGARWCQRDGGVCTSSASCG